MSNPTISNPTLARKPRIVSSRWIPLTLFVVALLALDLFDFSLQVSGSTLAEIVSTGSAFGQLCFISILAGLYGRCWLAGIAITTPYTALGIFFIVLGPWVYDYVSNSGLFFNTTTLTSYSLTSSPVLDGWGLFLVPIGTLIASFPLLVSRILFGWQLTLGAKQFTVREPIRLIDLFLVTTSLASVMWMARIPSIVWDNTNNDFSSSIASLSAFAALANIFVVVPCVHLFFRAKSWLRGVSASFGISFLMSGLIAIITSVFSNGLQGTNIWQIGIGVGAIAGFVLTLGLVALRVCGFRLLTYPPTKMSVTVVAPVINSCSSAEPHVSRNSIHIKWTALIASISIVSSVLISQIISGRRDAELHIAEIQKKLSKVGGSIDVKDRRVIGLTLGPKATAGSFDESLELNGIESLSIAHTQLSDHVIQKLDRFPKLISLDLSYSDIDEAGLKRLQESPIWERLAHLSLAGAKIKPNVIGNIIRNHSESLISIDLSDLGLTENDVDGSILQYKTLSLANNRFTDRGLVKLLARPFHLHFLDLSENPINGSGFVTQCFFERLVFEETPLADSDFGPQLKNLHVTDELVLRRTQLTDAFLPWLALASGINGIELGDGNFSEAGLQSLKPKSFYKLSLTGKQFTGVCFRDWQPSVSVLSMSGSNLDDETIGFLCGLSSLSTLNLSRTSVTDKGLAKIKGIRFSELDISNTMVTAHGVMAMNLPSYCTLHIAAGQFTETERVTMRNAFNLDIGMK